MIFSTLSMIIAPYEIVKPGGMRAMDGPVMNLFFLYLFVLYICRSRGIRYRERIAHRSTCQKRCNVWSPAFCLRYHSRYICHDQLDGLSGRVLYCPGPGWVRSEIRCLLFYLLTSGKSKIMVFCLWLETFFKKTEKITFQRRGRDLNS